MHKPINHEKNVRMPRRSRTHHTADGWPGTASTVLVRAANIDKYITGGWGVQTRCACTAHWNDQGTRKARQAKQEESLVSPVSHLLLACQAHLDSADAHDIAFFQACGVAHFDLVYECSIRAVQIFEHPDIALQLEARVLRGEESIV